MLELFVGENRGTKDAITQYPSGGGPVEEHRPAGGVGDKV